jgi:peptide/nickel transport system substrate-binding protein
MFGLRLSRSHFLRASAGLVVAKAMGGAAHAQIVAPPPIYAPSDYREQRPGKSGGTLRISVATDTGTLDPHALSATNVQWIGRILFDNLVYLDESGNITPWLAKSWSISPDGKIYTFNLRDDVTFSDGSKFNAEAVLLNLQHMRDPKTKSPLAGTYIQPYASGRIVDDYTFEATLHKPYSPFLNVLAQSWLAMESPKVIREHAATLLYKPIGSGPFVLENYAPQQGMSFVRRPDYNWSPPLIGHQGPAYLDRLEFEFVPDASVRYFSLASNEYHFTIDVPSQAAAAVAAQPDLVMSNRIRMGAPFRPLAFNVTKPPFDDIRIRRGVARSLNRDGLTEIAGFGLFRPISNFLSETTQYFDDSAAVQISYDPGAGAALFDEAGWTGRDEDGYRTKNGKRLAARIALTSGLLGLPVLVQIQSDLRAAGFDLSFDVMPTGTAQLLRNNGDYQAMSGGVWHTNTPDALYINYHGSQIPNATHAGQNVSQLNDPQLNALLEQARQSHDPAVQKPLYAAAQARLIELVPAVPAYENQTVIAYHKIVQGVIYDTSHETPHFETIWFGERTA